MRRRETIWQMKNPLTLHMRFTLLSEENILAEFPSLPGCRAYGSNLDEAVLNLAKEIQNHMGRMKGAA